MPPAKPPRQGRWSRFNSNHVPRIKVGLTCLAIGFIVGALAFVFIKPSIPGIFASETHEDNRQILQAVTRQQNIELLKVRVQGIAEKDSQAKFMGYKVPGANRALYLQYAYGIQLGIDGSQVQIKRVGEDHYRLTIPAFKVPGHSNIDLKKAVEKNGAISLVAPPEIDAAEMASKILSEDAEKKHIADNRDALQQQSKTFYDSIIHAINPDAKIDYDFAK